MVGTDDREYDDETLNEDELRDFMSDGEGEDDDELETYIKLDTSFASTIIADNLPVVGKDKYEKLLTVVQKIFLQFGQIKDLRMPFTEGADSQTKGFAFITYANPEEAAKAQIATHGWKLDKAHVFAVTLMEDFDRLMDVPDTYTPPQVEPYQERPDLRSWLQDPTRDQFVIRFADETQIMWNENTPNKPPELAYGGEREKERGKSWTEMFVTWSPLGSYLATYHRQGIVLWGGDSFEKLTRFSHPNVKMIEFSPMENYLVTWNGIDSTHPNDPECCIVWDARSGKKLRGFAGAQGEISAAQSWPLFKWSSDDKYIARLGQEVISIYETPSMKLIEDPKTNKRTSLKADGIKDFSWSPGGNYLATWMPEKGNAPARVTVISIPSREEVVYKNLFNVSDCAMHWQNNGDFLCVKIQRLTKSKKSGATTFEIFRMREKNFPVEMLEIKDRITAFAWEPKGTKFAIIHGEGPRYDVSFYTLETIKSGGKLRLIGTLEKKTANHLFWAPRGGNIILAGLQQLNGQLEFVGVKDNKIESYSSQEHFMCTDVEWDPSGRFCITAVTQSMMTGSSFRYTMEAGFNIWTFQGQLQYRATKERFYQIMWRPRPRTLLTPEQEEQVRKNLKEFSKKYDLEDDRERMDRLNAERARRAALKSSFLSLLEDRQKEYQKDKDARERIRGALDADDEENWIYQEATREEIVDYDEEILE